MLNSTMRRHFSQTRQLYARDFQFTRTKDVSLEQSLTPKTVFDLLEKRVVGQTAAKRMLAIAYRRTA